MRRRRTVPKVDARRTAGSGDGAPMLKVLAPPLSTGDATGESVAEHEFGSVEAMFREISVGDLGDHRANPTQDLGKYDDLWQLALADPITGLANRMLLLDRLNREMTRQRRHGGCVIVSHIDLRNLDEINEELGYSSGNEVLKSMSRRLTSMLRSEDTVSRVSESELVAVMTIEDERYLVPLMRRVQEMLDNPIAVTGRHVRVSARLGTVTAGKTESAEEVLERAGHAA